jgi:PhnB protein
MRDQRIGQRRNSRRNEWTVLMASQKSVIEKRGDMQMNPYLSFKGECEAAFKFYEQCLGGRLGAIFRYAGTPLAGQVPADWSDKVMHGSMTIGNQTLLGADSAMDQYEEPKGFSLTLQIKSTADAERTFNELAEGGRVVMPLEKTFWAARFGMLVDRFGIPWMINCDGSDQLLEG